MQSGRVRYVFQRFAYFSILMTLALALAVCGGVGRATASEKSLANASSVAVQATSNAALETAKKAFGVAGAHVIEATNLNGITTGLTTAASKATASSPYIVHVSNGSFDTSARIVIPKNVVLVSESGVEYTYTGGTTDHFITVRGSLYGGIFDGGGTNKAASVIRFGYTEAFTGINGIVQAANISNGDKNGICIRESACRNVQVKNCTIYDNYWNGITIEKDAQCALISDTVSRDNGHVDPKTGGEGSGINISHSNVAVIKNCTIADNEDKGISTNSDPLAGYKQPGCAIGSVSNCVISGNGMNGVYIKPKCTLDSFTNNIVKDNADGLTCSGKTEAGTTGASSAKNVANNTFSGNKQSQVTAGDPGAVVYLGAGNKIVSGKRNGVLAKDKGVVYITGAGNIIENNAGAGVSVITGGTISITGANTAIRNNKANGIYVSAGTFKIASTGKTLVTGNAKTGIYLERASIAELANVTVSGTTGTNIGLASKSKLTLKKSNKISSSTKAAGLYVAGVSTVNITGDNNVIEKSKTAGISVVGKSKVSITGKNTTISKNKDNGVYVNGGTFKVASAGKTSITGNSKTGLYLAKSSVAELANVTVSGTTGTNIGLASKSKLTLKKSNKISSSTKAAGLYVAGVSTVNITGDNNVIEKSKTAGISVADKSKINITGKNTTISSSGGDGVYVKASSFNVTSKGSTYIKNNKKSGIYTANLVNGKIKNVVFSGNKGKDIYVKSGKMITVVE